MDLPNIHYLSEMPPHVAVWDGYLRRLEVRGRMPITFTVKREHGRWFVDCRMGVDLIDGGPGSISLKPQVPTDIMSEPVMQGIVIKWCQNLYLHELRENLYCDGVQADPPHDDHKREQIAKLKTSFWDRFFDT